MRTITDDMDMQVSLAGQFLLAMPGIGDPRFDRAVIAMCVHDERGALGVGIGHVVPGISLHSLLEQLEIPVGKAPDIPIHHGGPVETQRGFVLHSPDYAAANNTTVTVGSTVGLTATVDVLKAIADGKAEGYPWIGKSIEHQFAKFAYPAPGQAPRFLSA